MRARASILVGLLWCLAIVSLVVIGFLHTARMDLILTKNYGDRIQARYLALAGIEKAKALLYQTARERSQNGNSHDGGLHNAPDQFRGVAFGRGRFEIFRRGRDDEGGGIIYGVSDEECRLNINTATAEELQQIQNMTPDVIGAITDWRDGDNVVSTNGAEADFYLSLMPPYQPRNGPFQTIRELLMVRGVTRDLLLARDAHENGLTDAAQVAGTEIFLHNDVSDADLGWAGMMTTDSSVQNVNAAGDDRVNVQTADESSLTSVRGLSANIARAIVSYRGQNQLRSIADLLDVTAAQANNLNLTNSSGGNRGRTQGAQNNASGPKVISQDLLMEIGDDITTDSGKNLTGAININTAGLNILTCLPGLDRQLAQAIISFRQSSGYFPNVAHLLKVSGMTVDIFKQIAPLVTTRSETFRILCEGKINSTGVRQRIEEIVHIGLNDVTTRSYREDDL